MTELTNNISKMLYRDKSRAYSILTFLDLDETLGETFIHDYIQQVLLKNPILKQTIVEKANDAFFLVDMPLFDIKEHYSIKYIHKDKFNKHIYSILNTNDIQWYFMCCVDEENNRSRMYFKIHHAYADGYKLINMLMTPFNHKDNDLTKQFKRTTNNVFENLYYYIIGTLSLVLMHIRFLFNLKRTREDAHGHVDALGHGHVQETDYLICKKLNLDHIKQFTKAHHITVNDFLYSLMIKTDKLYRQREKKLIISSPINTSGLTQINNMAPIVNIINNAYDNKTLLNKIHATFNNIKYSLFIPILNFTLNTIANYVSIKVLLPVYNRFVSTIDYIYSNMIGPSLKDTTHKLLDFHFLTTANHKEIIYNIISCENNINIICSFKKNGSIIHNKNRFKKCFYKAYKMLLRS